MLRSEKTESVSQITNLYQNNSSVIITHYHGLSVKSLAVLRKNLKKEGAGLKIVKNTLAKIAAKNSGIEGVEPFLKGPVAIAYSSDPVSAAKVVSQFAKENQSFKVVGGILEKNAIDAKVIMKLSTLPSLTELRGKIVGAIVAPATKIACIASAPAGQLARVIGAYSKK
ncbi:MAG: 50S ribosomal protein L10 [Rickettsiaceae bacterium]|nr:50S ribosomal protein L10 [Rickettsiaceae bacterium]